MKLRAPVVLLACLLSVSGLIFARVAATQSQAPSVVGTLDFNPPGVVNNVGGGFEAAFVPATGLLYVGTTEIYGSEIGVVDTAANSLSAVIPLTTAGPIDYSLVNRNTGFVYFRQRDPQTALGKRVVVVDARPTVGGQPNPSFNTVAAVLAPASAQSFGLDETNNLLYVTSNESLGPAQVFVYDVDPAHGAAFNTLVGTVNLPVTASRPRGVVALPNGKAYVAVVNATNGTGGGGVYVVNGLSRTLQGQVSGTTQATSIGYNASSGVVYAGQGAVLQAVDTLNGDVRATIAMPAGFNVGVGRGHERYAFNGQTGRVYVTAFATADLDTNTAVVVVDGQRYLNNNPATPNPNFNTLVTTVTTYDAVSIDIAVDEASNRVVVPSFTGYKTFVIDGATNSVVATIPFGQTPSDVALDAASGIAYVPVQHNYVQKINVRTGAADAAIPLAGLSGDGDVNPNTGLFYVGRTRVNTELLSVDGAGLVSNVPGAPAHGHGTYAAAAHNAATNRVYVVNDSSTADGTAAFPGYVSVVDGATNSVIANVPAGAQPGAMGVNETTNKVYIVDAGFGVQPGGITVLDGATNTSAAADTSAMCDPNNGCPGFWASVAVNPVTNKAYAVALDRRVGVIDGATNVVTALSTLPASPGSPVSLAVDRNLNQVYVGAQTDAGAGALYVLNGADNSLAATISLGSVGRVAVNNLTGKVFVTNPTQNTVTVVNGATRAVAGTVAVGAGPVAVKVNEAANRVYVGNRDDKSLTFINGATLAAETLPLPLVPTSIAADAATTRVYVATETGADKSGVVVIDDPASAPQPTPTPTPTPTATPMPTPGTTFVVNSEADTNDNSCDALGTGTGNQDCTLREAVGAANAAAGTNTINFNIPGAGAHTINATNSFFINKAVLVDATTQPGFAGTPVIEINGAGAGQVNGFWITGGGTRLRGLVINRFFYSAVNLQGDNNAVEGCYIGTNLAGNAASPNGNGVNVQNGANNVVGGTTPAARNVISGNNGGGVSVNSPSTGTKVQGNYIGLNAAGTAALPQPNWAPGVGVYSVTSATVGGTEPGAGNVISGNKGAGVFLSNTWPGGTPGASGVLVQGNLIGTGPGGLNVIANEGGPVSVNAGSSNNLIGGATAAARNVIVAGTVGLSDGATGNRVQGNYIGLLANGTPQPLPANWMPGVGINSASGNFVGGTNAGEGNFISGNSGPGVWLSNMSPGTPGSNNNFIRGNVIGLRPDGAVAPNNSGGVQIANGSSNNTVGGDDAADGAVDGVVNARNIIAGNNGDGVNINNNEAASNNNAIVGNYIGVKSDGNTAAQNNSNGVSAYGVSGTQIVGNVISGNRTQGVQIGSNSPGNGAPVVPSTNTLVQGNRLGTNAAGTAAVPNLFSGVAILSADTTQVVGNQISGNSGSGISIGKFFNSSSGSNNNVVRGNFIGTTPDGLAALPNNGGINITAASSGNVIGGASAADRNVISGNTGSGINIGNNPATPQGTVIQNNYIGIKANGTAALANTRPGVELYGAVGTQVLNNVLSGNGQAGLHISGGSPAAGQPIVGTTGTVVKGNFIGTDPTGSFAIPNASSGINFLAKATANAIGGTSAADRNVISGNNGDGIQLGSFNGAADGNVIQGNYIGTNAAGTAKIANTGQGINTFGIAGTQILGNVISGNNFNGVNLSVDTSFTPAHLTNNTVIQGNLIGTNAAGTAAVPNGQAGINLTGAPNNQIGGAGAAGNVVSGNAQAGIALNAFGTEPNVYTSDGNTISGNYVGLNRLGNAALANGQSFNSGGVQLNGASNNNVTGNVISGNAGNGLSINYNRFTSGSTVTLDRNATNNNVTGNLIGTNAAGTAAFANSFAGVAINGATANHVGGAGAVARNVISGNTGSGVALSLSTFPNGSTSAPSGNFVEGNYIGTNAAGTAAVANNIGGVSLNNAPNNFIGTPGAGNVISGNTGVGVNVGGSGGANQIQGNLVGVKADGSGMLGNTSHGIFVSTANNLIGGTTSAARNVVSGNAGQGINVSSTGNLIKGNYVGAAPDGVTDFGNALAGVVISGTDNVLGGTEPGAGNVVAYNGGNGGIRVIGTRISILSNSFFSNDSIGISLDPGANGNQAAPMLTFASTSAGVTTVTGALVSTAATQFRVEFFSNTSCDPSGAGEGQTFIGSLTATTDAAGNADLTFNATPAVAAGQVITATATGPNGTSRFSQCSAVAPATVNITGRVLDGVAGVAGATVTLAGGQSATATTDSGGNYSFANLPSNATYTVSAAAAGQSLSPASWTFDKPRANQLGNFTVRRVEYAITDLGTLGGTNSFGIGLNESGQVVGRSQTTNNAATHGFLYANGAMSDLGTLGGTNSDVRAVNDSGKVVGDGNTAGGANHAFVYLNGTKTDLGTLGANSFGRGINNLGQVTGYSDLLNGGGTHAFRTAPNASAINPATDDLGTLPGGSVSLAFSINESGHVAGYSNTTGGANHAYLYDGGTMRDLGTLGGTNSFSFWVNDSDVAAGRSEITPGSTVAHAAVFAGGAVTDIGTLGGLNSSANAVNNSNVVVGHSEFNPGNQLPFVEAFVYKNGVMVNLNARIPANTGWSSLTTAQGVNDAGQITGYGVFNGVTHAFLLTPTKTPQTVTFDPVPNKTYGGAPFNVNATASSGLAVTYSVVSGPALVSGNTVTITGAGAVTLRASQAGDGTYSPASADQTFTVAPAVLRVLADSKIRLYGAPNPTFTAQFQGFKYADGPSVLAGTLSFNVTAPDAVGVYANAIVPSGLSAANYVLQYSAGTLTVEKASTTTASGNYSLTVPGTVNLVAQVTPDAPSTQTVAGGTVTFTIRQGSTNVAQVTSGAVANGQATAQTPALGTGAYTVYASYGGSANYDGSVGLASITVGTANPVPSVTGLTPDSAVKKASETGQFTLLIDGGGFMATSLGSPADSTVDWHDRTTGQHTSLSVTSITAAQIQAVVPYDLIRDGKTVEVSVVNPGPGGGTSNAQPFFVTDTTATVTSSDTVLPDPVTGTASTTSVSPSGATLSAEASSGGASGSGTLTVAQYSGDPVGTNSSPGTSAFSTAEGSGYFDVYVAPGSSFTSLTLEYANTGGTTLYWWDGTAWSLVSNQSYNAATGVITVTVTTTSSPSIAQLTGTVFGVASGPAVTTITVAPSSNVALGTPVTLSASFNDSVPGATYAAEVNWGDGQTTTLASVTGTSLSAPHTYTAAGSYTVKVKVARGESFGTSTFAPLVVYSTAAGWVTGGGWFNSPLGSLAAGPSFTGKTYFQLGVKYQQGAGVPSALHGLTLTASGMKFEATRYDWLTVTGALSQFAGAGTVNGAAGYDFLVTGFDGKLDGKQTPDKLRVKVWNHSTGQVVYDNQPGAPNSAPPAVALGGGDVTVHK